jgi:hypothetical protein
VCYVELFCFGQLVPSFSWHRQATPKFVTSESWFPAPVETTFVRTVRVVGFLRQVHFVVEVFLTPIHLITILPFLHIVFGYLRVQQFLLC